MVKEAKAELDAIPPEEARLPQVVAMRVGMLQASEQWRALRTYAKELVAADPDEAGWWIVLAFAARRATSVKAAEKVLLDAEKLHPRDPTVQFNLGCYACLLGKLTAAKERVVRAIALDSAFLKNALEDPDLQALREAEPDWINSDDGETRTEA